jgi:hypothetical protein
VVVPFVPPEEAAYFAKEATAAFQVNSAQRVGALLRRPYYYAWRLHIEFTNARETLQEVDGVPEIVGIKMRIRMASRLPWHLSEARSSWDDYISNDHSHTLTGSQVRSAAEDMTTLTPMSGFYIWCLAGFIDEKK